MFSISFFYGKVAKFMTS